MGSNYDEAAAHFDREHVPADLQARQDIHNYLNDNFRDSTVGAALKSELADRIAERRGSDDAGSGGIVGDGYFDPSTGGWRDVDTGQFTSPPDGGDS